MVASGCIRPPRENFSLRKLEDSHVFTERHRYAGQMLRRIRCAVFVHFASDSDSRCLSFFTHRENLPGVHRHAEQAHLRATTRWHALCLIPSQPDRHKQPQWDDLPNRPESTGKRGDEENHVDSHATRYAVDPR